MNALNHCDSCQQKLLTFDKDHHCVQLRISFYRFLQLTSAHSRLWGVGISLSFSSSKAALLKKRAGTSRLYQVCPAYPSLSQFKQAREKPRHMDLFYPASRDAPRHLDLFYPASREAPRIFTSHISWEIPWIRTGLSWYGCAGAAPAGAGAVPAGAVPAGAVPAGAVPAGAVPAGAVPAGAVPAGADPAGAVPAGADAVPAAADVFPEESLEAPAGAGATPNRAGAALSVVAPAGTSPKCIQI